MLLPCEGEEQRGGSVCERVYACVGRARGLRAARARTRVAFLWQTSKTIRLTESLNAAATLRMTAPRVVPNA